MAAGAHAGRHRRRRHHHRRNRAGSGDSGHECGSRAMLGSGHGRLDDLGSASSCTELAGTVHATLSRGAQLGADSARPRPVPGRRTDSVTPEVTDQITCAAAAAPAAAPARPAADRRARPPGQLTGTARRRRCSGRSTLI